MALGDVTSETHCRAGVPLGVKHIRNLRKKEISYESYRTSVFILTFFAYSLYHASRKPPSIVKDILASTGVSSYSAQNSASPNPIRWPLHKIYIKPPEEAIDSVSSLGLSINACAGRCNSTDLGALNGWAPFDGDSGTALLGDLDVSFLAFYALGTFFAGHMGDRVCLRWFLTAGMIGSGLFVCLFGMAYWWKIHWLPYFFLIQSVAGLFQATGWPSVVTVVANWFPKKKRGLIMGVWNAHTSVGNIMGSLMASSLLGYGWGWAFVVPGIAVGAGGILVFLFLLVDPEVVGLPSPHKTGNGILASEQENQQETFEDMEAGLTKKGAMREKGAINVRKEFNCKVDEDENVIPLLTSVNSPQELESGVVQTTAVQAVGFFQAWAIPGVAPFAFCLFFAKLVAYTFLYWLPFYIRNTEIQGEYLSEETAGNLSTLFDVGGVVGGILAGHLSDKLNARAITAASFTYCAVPALFLYRVYGSTSLWMNVALLFVTGFFVNGPYALITTAVSADLGTHHSVKGNARALATVTAIIDGTGSIGAALGPLITGYISEDGWNPVFIMLTLSSFVSGFLLTRLVVAEVNEKIIQSRFRS